MWLHVIMFEEVNWIGDNDCYDDVKELNEVVLYIWWIYDDVIWWIIYVGYLMIWKDVLWIWNILGVIMQ